MPTQRPPKASRLAARTSAPASGPRLTVSTRGASRLKSGHVWVYRSDVVSVTDAGPGSVVGVYDERGRFLGAALYSSSSQIALRMISPGLVSDLPALLCD